MTRYSRWMAYCDQCGAELEADDFMQVYDGEVFCSRCWREFKKEYLEDKYVPEHLEELLQKVEDELI